MYWILKDRRVVVFVQEVLNPLKQSQRWEKMTYINIYIYVMFPWIDSDSQTLSTLLCGPVLHEENLNLYIYKLYSSDLFYTLDMISPIYKHRATRYIISNWGICANIHLYVQCFQLWSRSHGVLIMASFSVAPTTGYVLIWQNPARERILHSLSSAQLLEYWINFGHFGSRYLGQHYFYDGLLFYSHKPTPE